MLRAQNFLLLLKISSNYLMKQRRYVHLFLLQNRPKFSDCSMLNKEKKK